MANRLWINEEYFEDHIKKSPDFYAKIKEGDKDFFAKFNINGFRQSLETPFRLCYANPESKVIVDFLLSNGKV